LAHTGKLNKVEGSVKRREDWIAILCLRLAVLLCRRRQDLQSIPLKVSVKGSSIVAQVDKKWLATHPLTDFSLHGEDQEWDKVGFDFELIPV